MRAMLRIAIAAALVATSGVALAQSLKDQIVGTWRLVSIYNEEKGVKTHNFTEKPIGMSIYDKQGNVMQYLSKPNVPKFKESNRLKGSDGEYRTVMHSVLAGVGTYTVEGETVTINWTGSTFPNRVGSPEKRKATISGDELTVTNPTAASGGTSFAKYVRVK